MKKSERCERLGLIITAIGLVIALAGVLLLQAPEGPLATLAALLFFAAAPFVLIGQILALGVTRLLRQKGK